MPVLSIITAAHHASSAYLGETLASVEAQTMPPDWDLEWIVQEDGDTPRLADVFANVDCARYEANGAQLGIAATRNLGLSRARGDLIQVLDSDDVLLAGALAALIPHFLDPGILWAVGQADDYFPDGRRESWESAMPFGLIQPGAVNDWAIKQGGNWPIHCAGLMLRAPALRALGGWIGLPSDEDIAMFASLSEMGPGFNHPEITWLYRQHSNQTTRSAAVRHIGPMTRRFALQRVRAVRAARLQFGSGAQFGFDLQTDSVDVGPAHKSESGASFQ